MLCVTRADHWHPVLSWWDCRVVLQRGQQWDPGLSVAAEWHPPESWGGLHQGCWEEGSPGQNWAWGVCMWSFKGEQCHEDQAHYAVLQLWWVTASPENLPFGLLQQQTEGWLVSSKSQTLLSSGISLPELPNSAFRKWPLDFLLPSCALDWHSLQPQMGWVCWEGPFTQLCSKDGSPSVSFPTFWWWKFAPSCALILYVALETQAASYSDMHPRPRCLPVSASP